MRSTRLRPALLSSLLVATAATLAFGLVGLAHLSEAHAQDTWAMTRFPARGLEPGTEETFRELLQSKIASRNKARFMLLEQECRDVPCAQSAGQSSGAQTVVFGSLGTLGKTVVIAVTVVDAASGDTVGVYEMKVDRVEDLETAATRIADSVVAGKPVHETAELGNITHEESKPAVRMKTYHGGTFRVAAFIPMVDSYGDNETGVALETGYWFEANDFALEPRVGLRFDATPDGGSYFELPLDLSVSWLMSRGNVSPLIGLGGGLHWVWEDRSQQMTTGNVIRATNVHEVEDSMWGFASFVRAGVLFFRTYDVRIAIHGEFTMTFIELNGRSNPNAVNLGVTLIL